MRDTYIQVIEKPNASQVIVNLEIYLVNREKQTRQLDVMIRTDNQTGLPKERIPGIRIRVPGILIIKTCLIRVYLIRMILFITEECSVESFSR